MEILTEDIHIENDSDSITIAQESFAISVQQINNDSGQFFGVNLRNFSTLSNSLTFEDTRTSTPNGSIQLPSNLFSSLSSGSNDSRIVHAVFLTDSLFLRRGFSYQKVSSIVISASVVGVGTIRDLSSPVNLSFQLNPVRKSNYLPISCILL